VIFALSHATLYSTDVKGSFPGTLFKQYCGVGQW
jgi:hypothetical protein